MITKINYYYKKYVHKDIIRNLDNKARFSGGSKTVYAKGKTFLYKAYPHGDWFSNHGHGERHLEIYRKLRKGRNH